LNQKVGVGVEEANHKTHDLPQDEIIVPVQRMFPNCRKYSKCCTDDREFWDVLQERVKSFKPKKQPFRVWSIELGLGKPPGGFEGW